MTVVGEKKMPERALSRSAGDKSWLIKVESKSYLDDSVN